MHFHFCQEEAQAILALFQSVPSLLTWARTMLYAIVKG